MSYTVDIIKQPYEISFSGNPIVFSFAITPFSSIEQSVDIRLSVRVMVEDVFNSNIFSEKKAQPYLPNAFGKIDVDIAAILDAYLDYYTPRATQINPAIANTQRKRFKIDYLLQINNTPVGNTQSSDVFFVCKGGMSYVNFHPSLFFEQHVIEQKKPLFFPITKEYTLPGDTRFVYFLYPLNDNAALTALYTVYYDDDTNDTKSISRNTQWPKWSVGCIAAGFKQCDLHNIQPTKTAIYYTVEIRKTTDNSLVMAPVTFWIDYRSFYNTYCLLYRNSVGGLDTITLRGQTDVEQEYTREAAVRTVPPNTYQNLNVFPESVALHNEEKSGFKGDTGFVSKELIDRLRDLFLSLQVVEVKEDKLLPVNIKNGKTKFFSSRDTLLSLQVEWEYAFKNDYYTPGNLLVLPNACPAMDVLIVKQRNKNTLNILYSIPVPYDRVEFEIDNGTTTDSFIASGNAGSISKSFQNPATNTPVTITIKGRVLCNEQVDPVDAGPWKTATLQVIANSLPVATDDLYQIATGQSGAIQLVGSVLANDYDPDGDPIEVVAATNQATTAGGTYSIASNGIVTYTPPSLNYIGTDSFTYTVREVGAASGVTATVRISVGGAPVGIFAKLVLRNQNTNSSEYITITYGEFWIDFFADTLLTVPVDVTSLNLTVNYDEITFEQQYDGSNGTSIIAKTVQPSGNKVRIYEGQFYESYTDPVQPFDLRRVISFIIKPGTGYVPV